MRCRPSHYKCFALRVCDCSDAPGLKHANGVIGVRVCSVTPLRQSSVGTQCSPIYLRDAWCASASCCCYPWLRCQRPLAARPHTRRDPALIHASHLQAPPDCRRTRGGHAAPPTPLLSSAVNELSLFDHPSSPLHLITTPRLLVTKSPFTVNKPAGGTAHRPEYFQVS